MLHGAVGPPRGSLLMSWDADCFVGKKSKTKILYIFFIDVKLDFMRLAHHVDTFFILRF